LDESRKQVVDFSPLVLRALDGVVFDETHKRKSGPQAAFFLSICLFADRIA
jgi:hypothetical protein